MKIFYYMSHPSEKQYSNLEVISRNFNIQIMFNKSDKNFKAAKIFT